MNETQSLRFLVLRAVIVVTAVMAILLALRFAGLTSPEGDAPVQAVEELTHTTAEG